MLKPPQKPLNSPSVSDSHNLSVKSSNEVEHKTGF